MLDNEEDFSAINIYNKTVEAEYFRDSAHIAISDIKRKISRQCQYSLYIIETFDKQHENKVFMYLETKGFRCFNLFDKISNDTIRATVYITWDVNVTDLNFKFEK